MHDPAKVVRCHGAAERALLHQQLAPTAETLRERLGDGWACTVDSAGFLATASLRHAGPDYAVVLHISTLAGHEDPQLHLAVWQDVNGGDHYAAALVAPTSGRFDPDRVHAAVRKALADTDRLKARADVHTAAQTVLDDTLRRLRHEDPQGLLGRTHQQLHARFVADLAEALSAPHDTRVRPASA